MFPIDVAARMAAEAARRAAELARKEEAKRQAEAERKRQAAAAAAAQRAEKLERAETKSRIEASRYDGAKDEKVEIRGQGTGEPKSASDLQAYKAAADLVRQAAKAVGQRMTAGEARQIAEEKLGGVVKEAGQALASGALPIVAFAKLTVAAAQLFAGGSDAPAGAGGRLAGPELAEKTTEKLDELDEKIEAKKDEIAEGKKRLNALSYADPGGVLYADQKKQLEALDKELEALEKKREQTVPAEEKKLEQIEELGGEIDDKKKEIAKAKARLDALGYADPGGSLYADQKKALAALERELKALVQKRADVSDSLAPAVKNAVENQEAKLEKEQGLKDRIEDERAEIEKSESRLNALSYADPGGILYADQKKELEAQKKELEALEKQLEKVSSGIRPEARTRQEEVEKRDKLEEEKAELEKTLESQKSNPLTILLAVGTQRKLDEVQRQLDASNAKIAELDDQIQVMAARGVPEPTESAEVGESKPGDPTPYTVKKGDMLWTIAEGRLEESGALKGLEKDERDAAIEKHWKEIYAANKSVIGKDPDLILPGQRLELPALESKEKPEDKSKTGEPKTKEERLAAMDKTISQLESKGSLSERDSRQLTWLKFKRDQLAAAEGEKLQLSPEAKGIEKNIEKLLSKGELSEGESRQFQLLMLKRLEVGSGPVAAQPTPQAATLDRQLEKLASRGALNEKETLQFDYLLLQRQELLATGGVPVPLAPEGQEIAREIEKTLTKDPLSEQDSRRLNYLMIRRVEFGFGATGEPSAEARALDEKIEPLLAKRELSEVEERRLQKLLVERARLITPAA